MPTVANVVWLITFDWAEDQQLIAVQEIDGITYLRLTPPDPEQGEDA